MVCCYLGLGSNLRTPQRQLNLAIAALRKLPRSQILQKSSLYLSRPQGPRAQPVYYNLVIELQTKLSPHNLLRFCKSIETTQQRVHKLRWGARTIDIDILLYGDQIIHTHKLTIPHSNMHLRDFVLIPLLEITNLKYLPNGTHIANSVKQCQSHLIIR